MRVRRARRGQRLCYYLLLLLWPRFRYLPIDFGGKRREREIAKRLSAGIVVRYRNIFIKNIILLVLRRVTLGRTAVAKLPRGDEQAGTSCRRARATCNVCARVHPRGRPRVAVGGVPSIRGARTRRSTASPPRRSPERCAYGFIILFSVR